MLLFFFFFFKQKTAYEMCGRDWSSDVCSSDLTVLFDDGSRYLLLSMSAFSLSSIIESCLLLSLLTIVTYKPKGAVNDGILVPEVTYKSLV